MSYPAIVPFETQGTDNLERGADALLYVMAHGHAVTVPTTVLLFAEKVGVLGIARRDVAPAVLADVNRALDVIASTLRARARLDREPAATVAAARPPAAPDAHGGQRAKLVPPKPTQPPAAAAAVPHVADAVLEF